MTASEILVYQARTYVTLRTLWYARHEDAYARERLHHCVRVLRLINGHHYRPHPEGLLSEQIGAAIERLLDRQGA